MSSEALRKHVITYLSRHGQSDLYPHCPEFDWIAGNPDAFASITKEQVSRGGLKFARCRAPIHEVFHAGGFKYRLGTLIDPVLSVLYLETSVSMVREAHAFNPTRSHSYRLGDKIDADIFDPRFNWQSFRADEVLKARSHKYVANVDLANFYGSLTEGRLCHAWRQHNISAARCNSALEILHNAGFGAYGLPVGSDSSRLLAELTLDLIDRELTQHGIEFCRFVDDYRLYSDSKNGIAKFLFLINQIVIRLGFSINSSKTSILETAEMLEIEELYKQTSAQLVRDDNGSSWSIECLEDPYSSAIIDRIGELKLNANVDSIEQLILRESAKTQPSHKNLSVIIQALSFATEGDSALCLGKIFLLINKHRIFSLLPKLTSLVTARSKSLHNVKHLLVEPILTLASSTAGQEILTSALGQIIRIAQVLQIELDDKTLTQAFKQSQSSKFLLRELSLYASLNPNKKFSTEQFSDPWSCLQLEDHRG